MAEMVAMGDNRFSEKLHTCVQSIARNICIFLRPRHDAVVDAVRLDALHAESMWCGLLGLVFMRLIFVHRGMAIGLVGNFILHVIMYLYLVFVLI